MLDLISSRKDKAKHVVFSAAIFILLFEIVSFFKIEHNLLVSFLITISIGFGEEIRQKLFTKDRDPELGDFLSDVLGALIGLAIVLVL